MTGILSAAEFQLNPCMRECVKHFRLLIILHIPPYRTADASLSSGGGGDVSGGDSVFPQTGKPPSPNRSQSKFESNVFARLTSNLVQTDGGGGESQYKGHFRRSDSRTRNAGGPLVCSHTAQGHKGEVLSVYATDSLLFSASKGESIVASQSCLKPGWD